MRGFTLIEMTLALGLTALVVGVGFSTVDAIGNAVAQDEASDALAMEAEYLFAKIDWVAARDDGAAVALSGTDLVILRPDGTTSPLNGGGVRVEALDFGPSVSLTLAANAARKTVRETFVRILTESP